MQPSDNEIEALSNGAIWHIENIDQLLETVYGPPEGEPGVAYRWNPKATLEERHAADQALAEINQATKQVEQEIQKPDAKKALCRALKSASGDTWDIAKVVAPVLATLALTGVIVIPAVPFAIGVAAIVVARMGVAALCPESKDK